MTRIAFLGTGLMRGPMARLLVIDMGSVEPACDREVAVYAKSLGKRLIDAPVSGGVRGAEEQTLAIFAAMARLEISRQPPLPDMGPVGAGQTAKLANQLIVAITPLTLLPKLSPLADAARAVKRQPLRKALRGGFADSRILDLHGARMVDGDFVPGGRGAAQES